MEDQKNLNKCCFYGVYCACDEYILNLLMIKSIFYLMNALNQSRLDPSKITKEDLESLMGVLEADNRPRLIDAEGREYPFPEAIFGHLLSVLHLIQAGQAVVLVPENETYTTKAAANLLGMSRQYFVNLLERGKIEYHTVGSHRRVYLKDILKYRDIRDKERRSTLDGLFEKVDEAGLYFPDK